MAVLPNMQVERDEELGLTIWIDTTNGTKHSEYLEVGDVITNERGEPHQIVALEDGDIFEVSTQHFDSDSYRIWKGN